jgi:Xaa-Pro aminopeptidase
VTPPAPEDALWHGATLGLAELADRTGCRVRPRDELPAALEGRTPAALPAVDATARDEQRSWLGRRVDPAQPIEADARLLEAVIDLRLVHDEAAIQGLRRAAAGTTAAHRAGMAATRPGLREWAVRAAMERELNARGMGTAYGSIVTVHGEVLHNVSYHRELRDGDLLLADVGAETRDGWAGDVTRTWPVNGRFSDTQRAVYDVVLAAQLAAIDAAAPGVRYRDVHLRACRVIAEGLVDLGILRGDPEELVADGVHALFFPHGIGHLLGLDVHDMEDLGDRAGYAPGRRRSSQFGLAYLRLDRDLAPGMAVTIEPGFYQVDAILTDDALTACAKGRLDRDRLAAFGDVRGIRIEDDVLITEGGREVLTPEVPKSPADVEAAVG